MILIYFRLEWMNEYDHLVEQPKTPGPAPAPEPGSPMSIPTSPPEVLFYLAFVINNLHSNNRFCHRQKQKNKTKP